VQVFQVPIQSTCHQVCVCDRTEWLCSTADRSNGNTVGQCHRNFYTPIDTGYLNEEIPNDEQKDAMLIEEIEDVVQTSWQLSAMISSSFPLFSSVLYQMISRANSIDFVYCVVFFFLEHIERQLSHCLRHLPFFFRVVAT
jgi:hypothetical protein